MSALTWSPNGYGVHHLTPMAAGVMAVVEDHITHAVGVFVRAHKTVRTSSEIHHTVDEAKAWAEAQVWAMECAS